MELPRPLTENEVVFVQSFTSTAERLAKSRGVYDEFDIYSIAAEAGIEIRDLPKEGILIQAIWVSFLSVLRAHLPKSELKYQSLPAFLETYNGQFDDCSPAEMQNLMDTANWMNILFRFIPAKKNKGLAIAIIPKLIEGWLTKYVTGSGQKRSTADRVKIFETEGQVKPNQRGKIKPSSARHSHTPAVSSSSNAAGKPPKSRIVKKEPPIYIKRKKLPSAAPASIPMVMDGQYPDTMYSHHHSSLGLQLPNSHSASAIHDFTDTDHESSEDISHRTADEPDAYEFDFESTDTFFNRYEEAMMLTNPESAAPIMSMEECPSIDDDDIDFAEVLRLIRDPSTPNLNLRASNSAASLTKGASPRTRNGFISPNQSYAAVGSPAANNNMQAQAQGHLQRVNSNFNSSSNFSTTMMPTLKRSLSATQSVTFQTPQQDALPSTRTMTGDDTDSDDDGDEMHMNIADEGYAQFISPSKAMIM
jgi:hypothetical protein